MCIWGLRRIVLCSWVLVGVVSCGLDRKNPFDPKAPEAVQANSQVTGAVLLEGGGLLTSVTVTAIGAKTKNGASRRIDVSVSEEGRFLIDAPSDVYNIEAVAEGYRKVSVPAVSLSPGEVYDVGTLNLSAAKSSLTGSVSIASIARDEVPAEGATVTITNDAGLQFTSFVGPTGTYSFSDVPAGSYHLRARQEDFTPAYPRSMMTLVGDQRAEAPALTMYPASAVLAARAKGIAGARYTNDRNVDILLLAFVEQLVEMRVSLDASFTGVDWQAFSATAPILLADADGEQTIFAQFRDDQGLVTPTYSTRIVLDRAAPLISSVQVGSANLTTEGFVTSNVLPLVMAGFDGLSGVSAYQLALDGTLDNEAILPAESTGAGFSLTLAQAFPQADGPVSLLVKLYDRAGNSSDAGTVSLIKDTQAPVAASPAIALVRGGTTARGLSEELAFNVTGGSNEVLYVAIANAPGVSPSSARAVMTTPFVHTLASGPDSDPRQVCAMFFDPAGNHTSESCLSLSVDRTGSVSGTIAAVENAASVSGVSVTLSASGFTQSVTTPPNGEFSFSSVPAGSYLLSVQLAGYEDILEHDVTVTAGSSAQRGPYTLKVQRGELTGSVTKTDGGAFSDAPIIVSIENTQYSTTATPSGEWVLTQLPAGTYKVNVSSVGYFAATYGLIQVEANKSKPLGARPISPQRGSFSICWLSDTLCTDAKEATREAFVNVLIDCGGVPANGYFLSEATTTPNDGDMIACPGNDVVAAFPLSPGDGTKTLSLWYRRSSDNTITQSFTSSILLDTSAPVTTAASVLIDDGSAFTNHVLGYVDVAISADDGPSGSGLGFMSVSEDAGSLVQPSPYFPLPPRFVPYQATLHNYELSASDGPKTVWVQVCDQAFNCTVGISVLDGAFLRADSITLDRTPPSLSTGVSVAVNGGASLTSSPFVDLDITAGDATAVRFGATADLTSVSYSALAGDTSISALLQGADGIKTLYAQFRDAAGNESVAGSLSDAITLDTTPPTVSAFSIAAGAAFTTSRVSNALSLSASDANGLANVVLSNNATFTGATSVAPFVATTWDLSTGEGEKTVFARVTDNAGNSSLVSDVIVLDTVAPTASLILAANADNITSPTSVAVTLSTNEVVTSTLQYKLAAGSQPDCSVATGYVAWQSATTVNVPNAEGVVTVYGCARDAAGNFAAMGTDSVRLDLAAPTVTVTINQGDAYATEGLVVLTIDASDAATGSGVVDMRVSNDSGFTNAAFESIVSTKIWTLLAPTTDGSKTVYVQVRDAAGRTGSSSDTILLDTTPPAPAVSINSGATYSNSVNVTARVTAPADAVAMAFAVGDLDCATATYTTVTWDLTSPNREDVAVVLPSVDGAHSVSVCLRDSAGLTALASDAITLDLSEPAIAITVEGQAAYTTSGTVSVAMTSSVDATLMRVQAYTAFNSDPCSTDPSDYVAFVSPTNAVLPSQGSSGDRYVVVCVMDAAGNASEPAQARIAYDHSAPAFAVLPSTNSVDVVGKIGPDCALVAGVYSGTCSDSFTLTRYPVVSVSFNASDAYLSTYAIMGSTGDCSLGSFAATSGSGLLQTVNYTLTAGEGAQAVKVCVRDSAGRVSSATSNTITVDSVAPSALSFDSATAGDRALTVAWSSQTDSAGGYFIRYVNNLGTTRIASSSSSCIGTTCTITGLANCTPQSLQIAAVDAAGNHQYSTGTSVVPRVTSPSNLTAVGRHLGLGINFATVTNATQYRVSYRRSTETIVQTSTYDSGSMGALPFYIEGLVQGATYLVSVESLDSNVPGCYSTPSASDTATIFGVTQIGYYQGIQESEGFGSRLAMQDSNFDGFSDLLIGRPALDRFATNIQPATGGVMMVDAQRQRQQSPYFVSTNSGNLRAGSGVAAVDDYDGDGVRDWFIGAPAQATITPYAYLVSGADGHLLRQFAGPSSSGFGTAVAGGSDFNGDGVNDLAVGAPSTRTVYLFNGRDFNLPAVTKTSALNGFGSVLVGGAFFSDCGSGSSCRPFITSTPETGSFTIIRNNGTDQSLTFTGLASNGGGFGASIVAADLEGTSETELVFGSPASDCSGALSTRGSVRVFRRRNAAGFALEEDTSHCFVNGAPDLNGAAIAVMPDINGDNRPELVVGSPGFDSGPLTNVGRVAVYSMFPGGVASAARKPLYVVDGQQQGGEFGSAVAGGDFNNDGLGDFAASAPKATGFGNVASAGAVLVYSGSELGLRPAKSWLLPFERKNFSTSGGAVPASLALTSGTDGTSFDGTQLIPAAAKANLVITATDDEGRTRTTSSLKVLNIVPQGALTNGSTMSVGFGAVTIPVGDWNLDGVNEFVVTEPTFSTAAGRAFVYDGRTKFVIYVITPAIGANSKFGASAASLGDIDGDGSNDFAIGAPGENCTPGPVADCGKVYIYKAVRFVGNPGAHGSTVLAPTTVITPQSAGVAESAPAVGLHFGQSLVALNRFDLNSLDKVTLAIGVPGFSTGAANRGRVVLFALNSGAATAVGRAEGEALAGAEFGAAMEGGDLDGDGLLELIVGAPFVSNGGLQGAGQLKIFRAANLAPGTPIPPLLNEMRGITENATFGSSIVVVPDQNGDGFDDLALGGWKFAEQGVSDTGIVWIVSGIDGDLLRTISAPVIGGQFGRALTNVGDINRDGYPELAVGAPGYDLSSTDPDCGAMYVYSTRDWSQVFFQTGKAASGAGTCSGFRYGFSISGNMEIGEGAGSTFKVDGAPDMLVSFLTAGGTQGGVMTVVTSSP
jgi:hypothetical protein